MDSSWASVRNDILRYDPDMRTHRVAALAFDGMAPFELGVVTEIFALQRPELETAWWYSFTLCAEQPGPLHAVGGFAIEPRHGLRTFGRADTIVLLGTPDPHGDPSDDLIDTIRRAHARGARLVSICSGAFVLAATGLLDGKPAATHWRYASLLRSRYPLVQVDSNALYVDTDDVITSAGTAAGIDACLHIVRNDHGAEIANRVARRMVVAFHRAGGQAQYVERPVPAAVGDDAVAVAMENALARLEEPLSVSELAQAAHLSPRQFGRRFRAATGSSPARWLMAQRIDASRPLLEADDRGIERIGRAVGFASPAAFRRHFREHVGISPSSYRRQFRHRRSEGSNGGRQIALAAGPRLRRT